MSWHFSAALEAEFLEVTSSDGAPSALSSGCPILDPSSCNDKMTEPCDHSQSGTMSRPSTGTPGLDAWMLSRVGFRARTSPQQEKERESTAHALGCGRTCPESLAKSDPASRSWKTAQCSLLAGLDEFSETWPRWGTMRNGVCWERTTAEPRTDEIESGLWPTPSSNKQTASGDLVNADGSPWDGISKPHSAKTGKPVQTALLDAVRRWPTPTCRDWKSGTGAQERPGHALPLSSAIGGQLNPPWVEWLMGWPIGWTDSKRLETDKFQSWRQAHSGSCPLASEQ